MALPKCPLNKNSQSMPYRLLILRQYPIFISTALQSSQLFSTVSRTRLVYSLRFSLYRFDASTLAGEEVLGSFSRLRLVSFAACKCNRCHLLSLLNAHHAPLNTCQDRRNIVGRRPPVLQDIQTQLACPVYVRVEHLANELDARRLVRVCFLEMHDEAEGAILKGSIGRPDYDCVPAQSQRMVA
jgi:hypothetical protein